MTSDMKKRLRTEVENGGYTIIWAGAEMPCAFLNEKVDLIYEDMDGRPCITEAIFTYDKNPYRYNPYFKRVSDGVTMANCIAWRKHEEVHNG